MAGIESILGSSLGRKATETDRVLRSGRPCAANVLRECLEQVERLAQHQLSEFTDHGMAHISGLVTRLDTWEGADGTRVIARLKSDEAFLLLLGTITHDIGMLSQNEYDLQQGDRDRFAALYADVPTWVRRTHIYRISGILRRLLEQAYPDFVAGGFFRLACSIASSHQSWPLDKDYKDLNGLATDVGVEGGRICAVAGLLAVADLLDEDSTRCDSMTLFVNKSGTLTNRSHWLRHMLTVGPLFVRKGKVLVTFRPPVNLKGKIDNVFKALRNHFRLCLCYNPVLQPLDAEVDIQFRKGILVGEPVPNDPRLALLLAEPEIHLLRTFMEEALPADQTSADSTRMELVNRVAYDQVQKALNAEEDCADEKATYLSWRSREDFSCFGVLDTLKQSSLYYVNMGRTSSARNLAGFVIDNLKGTSLPPSLIQHSNWAVAFLLHLAESKDEIALLSWYLERAAKTATGLALLEIEAAQATVDILQLKEVRVQHLTEILDRIKTTSSRLETTLIGYDLIEILWGSGKTNGPLSEVIENCLRGSGRTQASTTWERLLDLKELAWRMNVQSKCLSGFGRWEMAGEPRITRQDWGLSEDLPRQSIAFLWNAWFYGELTEIVARLNCAHVLCPPGSPFRLALLEIEALCDLTQLRQWGPEVFTRQKEFRESSAHDEDYQSIRRIIGRLSQIRVDPKKEYTIYFGPRIDILWTGLLLGERATLRHWMLGSWKEVVGSNVRSILQQAYVRFFEDADIREYVAGTLIDLAWAQPYAGESGQILESLFPKTASSLWREAIVDLITSLGKSPPRIGALDHPGLKVIRDALPPTAFPMLAAWTNKLTRDGTAVSRADIFSTWAALMETAEWRDQVILKLPELIDLAIPHLEANVCQEIAFLWLWFSPKKQAQETLGKIVGQLGKMNERWDDGAKRIAVQAILGRRADLRECAHYDALVAYLGMPRLVENQAYLAALEADDTDTGTEYLLGLLQQVRDAATSRTTPNYHISAWASWFMPAPRVVPYEATVRAGDLLDDIWQAKLPSSEEVDVSLTLVGKLIEGATGPGLALLSECLLKAMSRPRLAQGWDFEPTDHRFLAWRVSARYSHRFPDALIPSFQSVVEGGWREVPTKDLDAVSKLSVEPIVRHGSEGDNQALISLLWGVRARVAPFPEYSARAYISVGCRLLGVTGQSPPLAVTDILADWCVQAAQVHDVETRRGVAEVTWRLSKTVPSFGGHAVESALANLRNDLFASVREAASGPAPRVSTAI